MKNQRYIELNILYEYILKTRKTYQKLIIYIISIAGGFRNNDKNKKKDDFENENVLKKILFDTTRFDSKLKMKKIQHLSKSIAIKNKNKNKNKIKIKIKKSRNNKFEKLLKFFNIYTNLHFANNAKKYATIMNSNILIKELKYKLFIQFFSLKIKSLIIILNNLKE